MESQQINSPDSSSVNTTTFTEPTQSQSKKILILPITLSLLVSAVLFAFGFYYFGKKSTDSSQKANNIQQNKITPNPSTTTSIELSPAPTTILSPTSTSIPETNHNANIATANGFDLKDIKVTLPEGWGVELNDDNLLISPKTGGGYLSIKVYEYPTTIGRREYYCQVTKICIEGTSYFKETSLGNINGYAAYALDNSGGGTEYFGAKGSKFYIISSFSPPSPNEFEKNYSKVLSSLVF